MQHFSYTLNVDICDPVLARDRTTLKTPVSRFAVTIITGHGQPQSATRDISDHIILFIQYKLCIRMHTLVNAQTRQLEVENQNWRR